jgi:hypothetical protein
MDRRWEKEKGATATREATLYTTTGLRPEGSGLTFESEGLDLGGGGDPRLNGTFNSQSPNLIL